MCALFDSRFNAGKKVKSRNAEKSTDVHDA